MEEVRQIPIWLECLLTAIGAVGGFEAIKYLINIKSHKKKEIAEANKADIDVQGDLIDLYKQTIEFSKEEMQSLRNEMRQLYDEKVAVKQNYKSVKYAYSELARKVNGMQNILTVVIGQKQAAETMVCEKKDCGLRVPPIGQYSTVTPALPPIVIPTIKGIEDGSTDSDSQLAEG